MVRTQSRKAQSAKVSALATVQAHLPPPSAVSPLSSRKRSASSSGSQLAKRPQPSPESSLTSPKPKDKDTDLHAELFTVGPVVTERNLDDNDYELESESTAELEEDLPSKDTFWEERRQHVGKVALELGLPTTFMDASHHAPWLTYLLGAVSLVIGLKDRINAFVNRLNPTHYSISSRPITDWMEDDKREDWHCHCPRMTARFTKFCADLLNTLGDNVPSGFSISELVKPSGALGAIVHTQWHYPVPRKQGNKYGHTMDPKNPSLRQQEKKFGHPDTISVADLFPFRAKYKDNNWETVFGDKWAAIKNLCQDFSYGIIRASPLVILVGQESSDTFRAMLKADRTLNVTEVCFTSRFKLFQRQASFLVVCKSGFTEIEQLVFSIPHGARFTHGATVREGILTDLICNAVASMGHLGISGATYFTMMSYTRMVQETAKANQKKMQESNGANGYAAQKEGPARAQEANGALNDHAVSRAHLEKAIAANSASNYAAQREGVKKTQAFNRANGNAGQKKKRKSTANFNYDQANANLAKGIVNSTRAARLRTAAKVEALLHTQEVRSAISGNGKIGAAALETLRGWSQLSHEQMMEFPMKDRVTTKLGQFAIFYSQETPNGLRWEGDGGPDIDWAEYRSRPCPAVALGRSSIAGKAKREAFIQRLHGAEITDDQAADPTEGVLNDDEDE